MPQKGIINIAVIIALVVFVVGVVGYFLVKKSALIPISGLILNEFITADECAPHANTSEMCREIMTPRGLRWKVTSNPNISYTPPQPEGKSSSDIVLLVDKETYTAGEKIIITLKNNSGDAISYSPYGTGCAAPRGEWWSLQYFDAKNKSWMDITTECQIEYMDCLMPSPEKRSGIKFQLLPGEGLTDSYDTGNYNAADYTKSFCVYGEEGDINFGTFRIKSSLDKKEIYSEPFGIRHLSEKQITPPDHIDGPRPPN